MVTNFETSFGKDYLKITSCLKIFLTLHFTPPRIFVKQNKKKEEKFSSFLYYNVTLKAGRQRLVKHALYITLMYPEAET